MAKKTTVLDLINSELNIGFLGEKIGDARWEYERYVPVEITSRYDNYSIVDYLIIYMIKRLYKLNKISESQKKSLIDLFNIKRQLEKKFAGSDVIYDKITEIEQELAKFGLIPVDGEDEFRIEDIIDKLIKAYDYEKVPNNSELEATIKRVREKK